MKELKGIISLNGYDSSLGDSENMSKCSQVNLTCCAHTVDVKIDGLTVHDFLQENFDNSAEDHFNGKGEQKEFAVRFVVMDTEPSTDYEDFEDLAARVIVAKFDGTVKDEYVSGCYSEWTCRFGNFNYNACGDCQKNVVGDCALSGSINIGGHDILKVLMSYVGKWIHIKFGD